MWRHPSIVTWRLLAVPELYGSDRGFFSEQNIASCAQEGVKVVCIPQRGGKKTPEREAYEKSADFKQGQRFRAGIEGRISVLFRGRGMKRCLPRATSASNCGSLRQYSPTIS
jgi:transposase, IS5 family